MVIAGYSIQLVSIIAQRAILKQKKKKASSSLSEAKKSRENKDSEKQLPTASQHLTASQRLSLHSLQRHLSLLRLEEYLLLLSFCIGGIMGRAVMQGLPSIEPITFFAFLSGMLFGSRKGAAAGAASWYLSNFLVIGGQGPWTIPQVLFGALAGYLGGFAKGKGTYLKAIVLMLSATVAFEVVANIASGFYLGFGVLVSFLTAIPFTIAHLVSNGVFALGLPKAKAFVERIGKLDEIALTKELMRKLRNPSSAQEEGEQQ